MKIESTQVTKLMLTDLDRLDPVAVIAEDIAPSRGRITITCYGEAWTASWGGIGCHTISQFFCSCDEHYIAKNLSDVDSQVYDIDAIREQAYIKGVDCYRDDPWNDYEFLTAMYGSDMFDWHDSLRKMKNSKYQYLCRIIKAVQEALAE